MDSPEVKGMITGPWEVLSVTVFHINIIGFKKKKKKLF